MEFPKPWCATYWVQKSQVFRVSLQILTFLPRAAGWDQRERDSEYDTREGGDGVVGGGGGVYFSSSGGLWFGHC